MDKEKKLLISFFIIGIILSLILAFLLYATIFGIAILSMFIIFPYLRYRKKKRQIIKFDQYLLIHIDNHKNKIRLTFTNEEYAKFLKKINLKETDKDNNLVNQSGNDNKDK